MSNKAGTLLWNRRRLTELAAGATTIDTGIAQPSQAFGNSSTAEPPLGTAGTVPPADGALPASRVQVIPMAPIAGWLDVTIGEPYLDTATGTVKVVFHNAGETAIAEVNVLFWDPHSGIGPGQADTYNAGGG